MSDSPLHRLQQLTDKLPIVLKADQHDSILDRLPVGIWQSNQNGQVTYANRLMCDMLGRTPEQMMGLGGAEGMHPDDRELAMATWAWCNEHQKRFKGIYRYVSSEGVITTVCVVCNTDQPDATQGHIGVALPMFEDAKSG